MIVRAPDDPVFVVWDVLGRQNRTFKEPQKASFLGPKETQTGPTVVVFWFWGVKSRTFRRPEIVGFRGVQGVLSSCFKGCTRLLDLYGVEWFWSLGGAQRGGDPF